MARKFDIPSFYRSAVISTVKQARRIQDQRKRDLEPSVLDLGRVKFKIARHFGFCFGVENAIEIAFRAIRENPFKKVYLLSEMIHNPIVNQDLVSRGVKFLLATDGTELISFDALSPEDIVIVPAFGTSVELFEALAKRGIDPQIYNATCPFVEKVWNRAEQLGAKGFTIIIHGKHQHEETKATFSHARLHGPSIVIRDIEEAKRLSTYITGERERAGFYEEFSGRFSDRFDVYNDLQKIGVVNQTTMLAGETQAISNFLKRVISSVYGEAQLQLHFADTRDTLCYATTENQNAVHHLVASNGDLALVIGGYNSSNTFHLAKLCEMHLPTYHIKGAEEILDERIIRHMELSSRELLESEHWLPLEKEPIEVLVTAGASSPDSLVDQCLERVASLLGVDGRIPQALAPYASVLERA